MEFIPGPMTAPDNSSFMTMYTTMAEKAGLTLAQAAEMRYDYLEEQVEKPGLTSSVKDELREEMNNFGVPSGAAKGSLERREAFNNLENQSNRSGGGSHVDEMAFMRQMMGQPGGRDALHQLFGQASEQEEQGRRVRAASLNELKTAVDSHSALQWDERMEALAGAEGMVKTDDTSDGTSQVRFPQPIGMVAWLPTSTLKDLD